jgi:DNA-binding response OmpR family regulator
MNPTWGSAVIVDAKPHTAKRLLSSEQARGRALVLYVGSDESAYVELFDRARTDEIELHRAQGVRAAAAFARINRIALFVVDHGPDTDALQCARAARRAGMSMPILALVGDGSVEPGALLDAGVDDTVTLPAPGSLLAERVRALLRYEGRAYRLPIHGGIVFQPLEHRVTVKGTSHALSPATRDLFALLAARPGSWVPVDAALQRLQLRLTGARGARHLKHRLAALRDLLGNDGISLQFSSDLGIRLDGAP